ncbi:Mu transposase C-terminal domain-containing protein [Pseudomonas sp. VI4.1]|uniref:Mu transposase C-terminal domain-containing protein n=1 Tax=Pseudomonas sp. VI4.1 TaxID=1941346 RepID=UPI0009C9D228|nr:Mu transposase C-terminal domain-containing protein [Pseudomonas sp. VI4.1]OPK06021.1 transposase [Pseudomonas sp. VI4.1]
MKIKINDVLEPVTEHSAIAALVRVLWLDEMQDAVCLIEMTANPPRLPFILGLQQIKASILAGDTKTATIKTPEYLLVLEESLDEKQKSDRDNKWNVISPLIISEVPGQVYFSDELVRLVAARAVELKIHRKQIYRLLCKYWINGQIRNALLKNYTSVGKSERVYNPERPPGRKPKFQEIELPRNKFLEPVDKCCIKVGYALYVDNEEASLTDAYHKMLAKFYTEKDLSKNPEAGSRLLPSTEIPSFRQFDYQGKKFFDVVATERGRMGEKKWLKDRRPLSGAVQDKLRGPCHQFEIDATIADVYLVNSYSRHMLIGRPVIYVVIDSFSGLIVGLYVGLEGPSWNGARQALFNAFTSKQDFCALNGVTIEPADWPCHHLPHEVFADRGEMLGTAAEGLAMGLGIELGIAPPYRPDWKSMVESRFNILNSLTGIRWLPGGVAAREKERGERDYRLDATLNMKEFTKIIIKCVLHYNRFNRQPKRLTKQMVADNVAPTPLSIWNWALENDFVEPNYRSDDLIYLHLLPRDNGTVQKGGVLFKGMYYISDMVVDKNWLAKARSQGVWSIQCWYDPNSADHIWIQGDDKQFVRCDLRYSDRKYASYRTDEIYDMLEAYRQTPPTHKRFELESRISLNDEIDGLVNTALKEKNEATAPKTKAEHIGNIRENRAEERFRERAEAQVPEGVRSVGVNAPQSPKDPPEHYAGARSAQVIDMLKRIRPGKKP